MWIVPKVHQSAFEESQKHEFEQLAEILKDMLMRLDKVLDFPAYNYIIHTSPFPEASNDYYHWHLEIMPKLTKVAGFEWGTGFYINPTPPEESAKFLREAAVTVTGDDGSERCESGRCPRLLTRLVAGSYNSKVGLQSARLSRSSSGSNSVVECDLAKVEVAGSNPVSRSRNSSGK